MGIIKGQITDKNNKPVEGADAGVMDRNFEPVYRTVTDAEGRYALEIPDGYYPFFIAVKAYGEENLEYWCNNIELDGELELNCRIDKLEIYGLNVFEVKGAAPALTIYFRPMSLVKVQKGEADIAPELTEESITCLVNGEECKLLVMNMVKEYTSEGLLTGCLIQVSRPGNMAERNKLDIILQDKEGNLGMASLMF
ncbi:MAG: carboxypeptidase-like regulatory domain-containing protein [Firmicutes bacterium]|nr:carboxypeptidase-like regulatory domain-containing protein [Bacillota bacterium]